MFTTIKKDYKKIGEQVETDYEYKQKAIKTELYYESGKGYFMTTAGVVCNTNKERGYISETTNLFECGYQRVRVSDKRKSKKAEEQAIQFYEVHKDYLIKECELCNPKFAID